MAHLGSGLFTSASEHYATSRELYAALNAEFSFNDDPCPLFSEGEANGLLRPWGTCTYINPPYGKHIALWLAKALEESKAGKTVVALIPSRTDTRWWHQLVMRASEIRFMRGRLRFGNATGPAPFPSAIVVWRPGP